MALLRQQEIVKLDYPSRGLPFMQTVTTGAVDSTTLDYVSRGIAFLANNYGTVIKTINGVALASVKTIEGVALYGVKAWNGIA